MGQNSSNALNYYYYSCGTTVVLFALTLLSHNQEEATEKKTIKDTHIIIKSLRLINHQTTC